jgi:hypothetical protein
VSRRKNGRLRLIKRSRAVRDTAFAATLASVLAAGILGVLLLNMSMQTQADQIAAAQSRIARLALQAQSLHMALDEADAPSALAARARALHLQPARSITVLSAHARAVLRGREG